MKVLCFLVIIYLANYANSAITYQLYTKMNPKMGQPLTYKNQNSISSSFINNAKKNK